MGTQEDRLTTEQAAEYLGVSYAAMAMWRYRNTGPRYLKIGNQVRYLKEDLDAFITVVEPGGGE